MPKVVTVAQLPTVTELAEATTAEATKQPKKKRLSPRSLCSIPTVPELMFSTFCLKFARYCLYMWLPLYLVESVVSARA